MDYISPPKIQSLEFEEGGVVANVFDVLDDILGTINVIDRMEGLVKRAIYRDTAVKFKFWDRVKVETTREMMFE